MFEVGALIEDDDTLIENLTLRERSLDGEQRRSGAGAGYQERKSPRR
jgi:hypothetical protein